MMCVMKKNRRWKETEGNGEDEWCTDDIWVETQANRKEQRPSGRSCFKKKKGVMDGSLIA